jgi:hypothetical protein
MRATERKPMRWTLSKEKTTLETIIATVESAMQETEVNSSEYSELMTKLERLYKIRAGERQSPVSRDTLALISGNLAGILLIIAYEQRNVITTKAFGQIIRPRTTQQM